MIRMHNEDKSDLDYLINILVENEKNQNVTSQNIQSKSSDESESESDESESGSDESDDFGIDFKVKEFNILQNNVLTFYDIILSLVISCMFYNIVVILSNN